jgi:hypothetical protein
MISSINQGSIINGMAYTKVNVSSKSAEEATESISEKIAEARNQMQSSDNSQVSKQVAGLNTTTGNNIDVRI